MLICFGFLPTLLPTKRWVGINYIIGCIIHIPIYGHISFASNSANFWSNVNENLVFIWVILNYGQNGRSCPTPVGPRGPEPTQKFDHRPFFVDQLLSTNRVPKKWWETGHSLRTWSLVNIYTTISSQLNHF